MIHVIRYHKNGKWYVRKMWLTKATESFEEYEQAMILALQWARKDLLSIVVYYCDTIKTTSVHPDGPGAMTLKDDDQLNFLREITRSSLIMKLIWSLI
ncbi:MAG: hypothetical protein P9M05_02775 [Candidatus Stygibacter australis]|nr:hypothetical protein [Candidatus Stygibacter australis]